jgi:geranylgeranyl transferase type-1 subunit beta
MEQSTSLLNEQLLLRWLVARTTDKFYLDDEDDGKNEAAADPSESEDAATSGSEYGDPNRDCLGFAGRPNKPADTCYAWWVGASLQVGLTRIIYLSLRIPSLDSLKI